MFVDPKKARLIHMLMCILQRAKEKSAKCTWQAGKRKFTSRRESGEAAKNSSGKFAFVVANRVISLTENIMILPFSLRISLLINSWLCCIPLRCICLETLQGTFYVRTLRSQLSLPKCFVLIQDNSANSFGQNYIFNNGSIWKKPNFIPT